MFYTSIQTPSTTSSRVSIEFNLLDAIIDQPIRIQQLFGSANQSAGQQSSINGC